MKRLSLLIVALLLPLSLMAQLQLSSLRVNRLDSPLGLSPNERVRLSWILSSSERNTMQTAYEVELRCNGCAVWRSGRVVSDNSIAVPCDYDLSSNTPYELRVRAWDNHGNVSKRISTTFSTGLRSDEWEAQWLVSTSSDGLTPTPTYFRNEYSLRKGIRRATAFVTSHGVYEAYINGQRVGNYYLTPGWTSYNSRLQYQAYDITPLLVSGRNMVGAVVASGWYSGGLNWGDPTKRFRYGSDIALLMQIVVEYNDGTRETLATSQDWTCSSGEVAAANIYDGETINRTRANRAWCKVGDESQWHKADVADWAKDNLTATVNEPVVKRKSLSALRTFVTPCGEKVIDFGQNVVGFERATLRGKKGDTVRISHAEVLDRDGNFYTTNLRRAKAESVYILGGGEEIFEPTMTFYGFRYIRVEGLDEDLRLEDFTAEVLGSGFDDIGSFSCSNEKINSLQSNIEWGFRGNFIDVPTDCPQRDERLGWTGDAQVFFRTASFLGRIENFFRKWLSDLATDQYTNGKVPKIIPDTFPTSDYRNAATGWADAATIIPWQHYLAYGDMTLLEAQYESMRRWVDYMVGESCENGYLWNNGDHYGDWLFWSKKNDPDGKSAVSSKHLIAQCFFAHSADIVASSARLLGKEAEAKYYSEVASNVRRAFLDEYVTPNGLVSSDTQTAYVLALHFDMLPEELRQQAVERLVRNIERYDNHITTGFLGTPYICNVLTDFGRSDMAYRLLLQESCPSWIYPISKGATTIWERWDSIQPDGSILVGMNSFNHYSYGAIGDWLYRSALGIREASAGYRTIHIRPHVGGGFTRMSGSTMTPYGKVYVEWQAENDILTRLDVTIPANTTAEIFVPSSSVAEVFCSTSATIGEYSDGYVLYRVGSGVYSFTISH